MSDPLLDPMLQDAIDWLWGEIAKAEVKCAKDCELLTTRHERNARWAEFDRSVAPIRDELNKIARHRMMLTAAPNCVFPAYGNGD